MAPFYLLVVLVAQAAFAFAFPVWDAPVASTTSGTLTGRQVSTSLGPVHQFLGVRYARPPVKHLRFHPSQPLPEESADDTVNARHFGASCLQPPHMSEMMYPQLNRNETEKPNSEDCLFLNVFVPPRASDGHSPAFPIIVWLPGEGFNYASGRQFDGSRLALHGQVMVVTINYRVSAFGFLGVGEEDAPGNVGLTDQVNALKWVRENAHAFGGDEKRVTLIGRFSGAMSITALMASPLTKINGVPLFHKAIVQSGVAGESWTIDRHPIGGARKLAKQVGCDSTDTPSRIIKCLRRIDAQKLNSASAFLYSWRLVKSPSFPLDPMTAVKSGKHLSIPVLIGNTNDEGSLCILTHKVLKSPHLSKLLDDTLDKSEFTALAKGFLQDYLHIEDDDLAEQATRDYERATTGTWRDRYVKLCGDGYIGHKTRSFARQLSIHGSRVYLYVYSHRPTQSFHPDFVRAAHGDDILFTFGLVHDNPQSTTAERHLSDVMMTAWTNFAKNSDPNPIVDSNGKEWPPFSIDNKKYWDFSTVDEEQVKTLDDDVDSFWTSTSMKKWRSSTDSEENDEEEEDELSNSLQEH